MNTSKSFWVDLKDKEFAHAYADEFLNILIATQIKVLRGKLRQEDIAQLSGMAQERISILENVNYSSWSVNTLRKLAKAFDLRLRITFETFSSLIDDIQRLSEEGLQRKTRQQELSNFLAQTDSELPKDIVHSFSESGTEELPKEKSAAQHSLPSTPGYIDTWQRDVYMGFIGSVIAPASKTQGSSAYNQALGGNLQQPGAIRP